MNEMSRPVSIMIVDDHVVVREGLKQILELEPDFEVIGEAQDGTECLRLVEKGLRPDVIFMDLQMPGINGIQTTAKLAELNPGIKVVMLTVYDDHHYVTQAIQTGAHGYVLKNAKRAELIQAVRAVISGESFLDPKLAVSLFASIKGASSRDQMDEPPKLTRRELEVTALLIKGLSDREIGKRLFISEHTSRTHLKNIYRKLEVSSRAQAAVKALKLGLVANK
jgi:DNA-binding NarL/FixJ family response regulator